MYQIRMNGALLGVVALVLAICGSGNALACYTCDVGDKPCTKNVTCPPTEDACLVVTIDSKKIFSCLAYNSCNHDFLAKRYTISIFQFNCCQKDLCNNSVMTTVNKAIFSLVTMLAFFWIFL